MQFIRILFVAVIGVLVWNVKGTNEASTLAQSVLPKETPGLEFIKRYAERTDNGKLIIFKEGSVVNVPVKGDRFLTNCVKIMINSQSELYFPLDYHQPTTQEAVRWSCASRNDNAVTEWYMRMFGWTKDSPPHKEWICS